MAEPQSVRGFGVVVQEIGKPVVVEELTFQPPGPGEVRVKMHACGLCQSDIGGISGKVTFPIVKPPFVLGHEGAGVVEAVGPGSRWKVGDRAILTLVQPCNKCDACLAGLPSRCRDVMREGPKGRVLNSAGAVLGIFCRLGCMADYAVVNDNALVQAPEGMPLDKGALVSCGVTTGAGAAINRAQIRPGSCCCVVGCGGVGLSAIQGARICGAKQIIAVDIVPSKLEAAKRLGATHIVNSKEAANPAKEISKLSRGGVDYGFEAIGSGKTAKIMIDSLKPAGLGVIVGVAGPKEEITMKVDSFLTEKTVTGSLMGSAVPSVFVPMLCDLYKNGDLLLDELISKYYSLGDAQLAIDDLASGSNLRGVLVMNELAGLASAASSKL